MTAIVAKTCSCPLSLDAIICGRCGGVLPAPVGMMSKINMSTQQWFYELESEQRLNPTLSMYMAIDRQVTQGAPLTAAVQLATKQITQEFAGIGEKVEHSITEKIEGLNVVNQNAIKQIGESASLGLQAIVSQVTVLVQQGKSASEIEASVKEAAAALQNHVLALKLPGIRGEEGERNVLLELQDAFLGQTCVRIEPIGGADATDALVTFCFGGVEIGRCLIEVKSRKNWSSDFLDQTRQDMKRYNAAFAILVVEKLPKAAKTRNYHVDAGEGLVIITTCELATPTLTMFYEIHASSFRLEKKALDFESLTGSKDLTYYINDNMKIIEDCKKITDIAEDSSRQIKERAESIGSRLQDNNRKIAEILSKCQTPAIEARD